MKQLETSSLLSTFTILVGLLLLGYTVSHEGEPGALPLMLVALGTSWQIFKRIETRARAQGFNDRGESGSDSARTGVD